MPGARTSWSPPQLPWHGCRRKISRSLFSNFTYALDNPERGDQFEQSEKRYIIGGDLSRTCDGLHFFGRETSMTLGLQTRTDIIDGIGLYKTEQRDRFSTTRQDDVTESSVGIFAESTVRWTPWLRTVAGVRADAFLFDVAANTRGKSGDELTAIISPKFTAILGPWRKTEVYLNFGTGFHSNDARGVNTTIDPSTGDLVSAVDPLVRTIGAEIGVRTQLIPKVTATLAAWWLESDSELVYVGDAGTNEPGPASRRYGIETAIYWAPRDWLVFDAEVALTHARFLDSPGAEYIPDSVPWMVSGGFTAGAQGLQHAWFSGVRVRAFGQRPLIEDNSVKGRATCTINANLGYRTERWEAAVECLNLLDRKDNDIEYFYASRLPGERDEGFDDIHLHPAEPCMFRARLTYRWWVGWKRAPEGKNCTFIRRIFPSFFAPGVDGLALVSGSQMAFDFQLAKRPPARGRRDSPPMHAATTSPSRLGGRLR
jgi:outer membrane receptor protein involved in Fe transport